VLRQPRLRIVPFLGKKALSEITQDDMAALRRRLIDTSPPNGNVNPHLAPLRNMFGLSLKWQVHEGRNPAALPGMLRPVDCDRFLGDVEPPAPVTALGVGPCHDGASTPAHRWARTA
jgi:hypothetical protein